MQPQATGPATSHQQGTQTNYVASGDVAGSGALSGASTNGCYYFLVNLASLGAVVTYLSAYEAPWEEFDLLGD